MKKFLLCLALCVSTGALAQGNFDMPPGGFNGERPSGPPPESFNGQRPQGPPPGGFQGGPNGKPGPGGGGSQYVTAKGKLTTDKDVSYNGITVSSDSSDYSALLCKAGTVSISNSVLTNNNDASSTDDASFFGINAVVCAQPADKTNGSAKIYSENNRIYGVGLGSNGVFAYGKSVINTNCDYIYETGGNSRGIMASGGGTINVTNDTVITKNSSSSCIATDRGGGTINVNGGIYTCYGKNSAGLYSTGNITATDATFISNGGEMMVIEGTNFITATNCNFTSNHDKWGVLLYQSFSGDAEEGDHATLVLNGGSLTYNGTKTGMFYNTNNRDSIYLNNVTLINKSDTLINSKKGGWGNRDSASRGGTLGVKCENQMLKGIIAADKDSEINLYLSKGSSLNGCINPDNSAKKVSLIIDNTTELNLTDDCYINGVISLGITPSTQEQITNVSGNGHNIYYNPELNPELNKERYSFVNDGCLLPIGTRRPAAPLPRAVPMQGRSA